MRHPPCVRSLGDACTRVKTMVHFRPPEIRRQRIRTPPLAEIDETVAQHEKVSNKPNRPPDLRFGEDKQTSTIDLSIIGLMRLKLSSFMINVSSKMKNLERKRNYLTRKRKRDD